MTEPLPAAPASPEVAAGSTGIRLRLLGGFRLERKGIEQPLSAGSRRLLAILGIRGEMTRTAAAGMLWPHATEGRAQGSLRTSLWRLGDLTDALVEVHYEQLALVPSVDLDIRSFTKQASWLVNHSGPDSQNLDAFMGDIGELLPGWYDDWVLFERERLRQLRLHALEEVALLLCQQGRYAAALEAALQAIGLEPLRESAHRTVIAIHLREENLSEALRHYHSFRQLLRDELGVNPSPRAVNMITARFPDAHHLLQ